MYYCPKCDRTISKETLEQKDRELRARYGVSKLSEHRCPVCDCEYVDLDKVRKGGEGDVGKGRQEGNTR